MPDIFDQLDEAPAVGDIFDEVSGEQPVVGDVFDQVSSVEPSEVPRGTTVEQEDPKPRLRREAFQMMNDAGRLSPRYQRDVADGASGAVGGSLREGKGVLGEIGTSIGEALTNPFTETEATTLDSLFGSSTGGKVADDLLAARDDPPGWGNPAKTKEVLDGFVKFFEGNGVTDGKEMMAILRDSVSENTWDSTTDDNARVLSDGTLRVNPKFVALPDAQEGIKAINASDVPQEVKDAEITNFQQARKFAAAAFDEKAKGYDADYRAHAEAKAAEGVTDPEQVFYSWPGLDRNWIEGSWDVVRDTVAEAGRGIANTGRSIAMGAAERLGAEDVVEGFGRQILESREKSGYVADIAAARDQQGPIAGTGKELGTTVLEMAPMFAGGFGGRLITGAAGAGTARKILGSITTGTSVYGYAGAQGYASLMQTALAEAEQKARQEGRELTGQEINDTVENFQGVALANGFQTAILARLLPEGAEKTAIQGLAAQGMTGRGVLSAIGKDGIRAAKPELLEFAKQAYRAGKVGFKDEALEEGVNQYLEGLITKVSGADADKTWDEIGQETFKGAWMGGVIGGGLPVAQQTLARQNPADLAARELIAGAAVAAPDSVAVQAAAEDLESSPDIELDEERIPSAEEAEVAEIPEEALAAGSPVATAALEGVEAEAPPAGEGRALDDLSTTEPIAPAPAVTDDLTTGEVIPPDPGTYSKENLAATFDLTPEQTDATDALVQAMGLDTSKIALKRGGTPGQGLLAQTPDLKGRIAKALPDADKQAAAAELGAESWTPEVADAFVARLSDWLVSGQPDPLEVSFRKILDSDQNLFQQKQGIKGSFERIAESGKMLLRGLANPDVSTGIHELAHVARQTLFDRESPVAGITPEDITVAEDWAGAKDGKWDTKAEEKFARGFERYLRDGKAPVPALESVFAKFADWLRSIYQTLAGSPVNIEISPEMRVVFDALVTRGTPPEPITDAAPEPIKAETSNSEVSKTTEAEPITSLVSENGVIPPPPAEPAPGRLEDLPPGVTGLQHAISDADRAKLGLPPRASAPPTTDQSAWDAAVAASEADPNAGSQLLAQLMAEGARPLTKYEHALLLHEKVRRDAELNRTTKYLNDLPVDASKDVRNAASNAMQAALSSLETLLTYADAAGSASGLSLQARKMLVAQDYTYAGVLARMLGAKNKFSDTRQSLTPAEMKEAAALSEKLQQAQARVDALSGENAEQARLIESLTKDIERAQKRVPAEKSKIRKALSARATAAKARLKDKGFLAQEESAQPDPSVIADAAAIAADWLVDEILQPFDFLTKALKEFGTWAADHIGAIRSQADQIYHETAASVSGRRAPTPEEVMDGVDPTEAPDKATVWALARAFVTAGQRGDNVLTSVHETLSTVFPSLTREKVAKEFTDYGKVSYPSGDVVTGELNKIRNLERTALKMLDLARGVAPKRTGFQRGEQDAEVRAAEKEFRAALKASGIEVTDPETQLKTALGAAKRRMENEIEELQLAIDAGAPRVKGSRGVELDDEGKALKKQLDEKRKAYEAAFPAEVDELQAAKDSVSASLDRYLQMLVRGDVSVPKKEGPAADAELEELRALRDTFAAQVREARNPKPTEAEAREKARRKAFENAEETLAELERRIAEGDLSKPAKGESPFAADLADLREKIAAGRKKLAEMRKAAEPKRDPEEVRVERLGKSLDKQIADETRRIAEGRLKDAGKTAPADTAEITLRRERLAELRQIRRDLWEAAHPGETALEQAKKAAEKAIENYRDILDGKLKEGKDPVTPDAELQALWDVRESLRDEVAEMRRALPLTPEAEAKQIAAALKSAQDNLVRLEGKLAAGDLSVPPARETAASKDARVRAVRARVAEMNKELARLRREAKPKLDPEVARLNRYLGSIKKRKEELERRMRENDFSAKAKAVPVNSPESRAADYAFAKVKAAYQEKLVDHMIGNASFTKRLGYRIRSTSNLMKVLTLGGDFGVLFRNLGGATTNLIGQDLLKLAPGKAGAKARSSDFQSYRLIREGLKAFLDPKYEVEQYEQIVHRPNAGYDAAFGMKYAEPFEVGRISTEDIPTANLIDKIPWWVWPAVAGVKVALIASNPMIAAAVGLTATKAGLLLGFGTVQKPLLQALDRAQRVMTNHARATLIDGLIFAMPGDTVSVEDGKALATAVMVGTGRGQAKSLESMMPAIQTVALAARFYLSRIQALLLYPIYSGKMSSDARKQVAGMYGKSVTGRAAIYTLLVMAFGMAGKDDDEDLGLILDPWSKDFGKVRVAKNTLVDVASGLNQWGHMMYRSIRGGVRDKATKKIKVYTPEEAGTDITRFFAGRRSLTFGYLWDSLVRKEYYGGKPRTFATALDEATSAIILNDATQVFQEAGPAKGAFIMGLMLSGGGVNVGSYEGEKAKWAELRALKEEERQAREDRLNEE